HAILPQLAYDITWVHHWEVRHRDPRLVRLRLAELAYLRVLRVGVEIHIGVHRIIEPANPVRAVAHRAVRDEALLLDRVKALGARNAPTTTLVDETWCTGGVLEFKV